MNAYLKGGGVQGLLGDEENEGLEEEDAKIIEEEFITIYNGDAKLREVLQGQTPETLSLREKYELLVAYKKHGGVEGMIAGEEDEDEKSVVIHNGKKFTKVQIEGEANDYFMDDEGNIYDGQFQFIGQAFMIWYFSSKERLLISLPRTCLS